MLVSEEPKLKRPKIRASAVALPNEHGSWGFLFEPLVAGIAVAPSPSSIWIALMVIGAFLLRQPLKVIFNGGIRSRQLPQTLLAFKFVSIYSAIFVVGAIGCIFFVRPESFIPFWIVLPLAAYQIYCDANRRSRQLLAELLGSIAISSSIAVIALADNWPFPKAAAFWAVIVARLIPSIIYVRNRLLLEKGKAFSRSGPITAHIVAVIAVIVLAYYTIIPFLPILIFVILLSRSVLGLSAYRRKVKAMKIGIAEVIYGALTVLSLIIGYYAGI